MKNVKMSWLMAAALVSLLSFSIACDDTSKNKGGEGKDGDKTAPTKDKPNATDSSNGAAKKPKLEAVKVNPREKVPTTSKERVAAFANVLPKNTPAMVLLGDLKQINSLSEQLNALSPELKEARKEATEKLYLGREAELGVNPSGGAALALANKRVVAVLYVDDQKKFDAFLTKQAKEELKIKDAPETVKEGGKTITVVGKDAKEQIAWLYDGKLAILASPAIEGKSDKSIKDTLVSFASTKAADSMASNEQFKQFFSRYADNATTSAYFNIKEAMKVDFLRKELENEFKSGDPKADAWVKKNLLGVAFNIGVDGGVVSIGSDVILAQEGLTPITAAAGTKPNPFGGFTTSDSIGLIRTSLNFAGLWKSLKTYAPKNEVEEMNAAFAEASKELGLDVQKDILDQITGNVGLFVYDFDLGGAMNATRDPAAGSKAVKVAFGIEFKDDKKLTEVADKILAKGNESGPTKLAFAPFEGVDGARKIDLPQGAGTFVQHKNMLYVATAGLTNLADRLNKKGGKALSSKLSAPFAGNKPHGGLYINITDLAKKLGPMIENDEDAKKALSLLKEVSVSFVSSDSAISADVKLHTTLK